MTREQATRPGGVWKAAMIAALFGSALLLPLALAQLVLHETATWEQNSARLLRSFALVAGVELYPAPGSGAALVSIYPPLGAIAYLPATLARTPAAAILVGQALSLIYILLPSLALFSLTRRKGCPQERHDRRDRLLQLLPVVLFLALVLDVRALSYAALTVHVDAPAIGFALSACAALLFWRQRRPRLAYGVSAFLACAAVWTKQVAVPVPLALLVWILLVGGRREALRFLAWLATLGLALSALLCAFFGSPHRLWDHLMSIPAAHSWQAGGGGAAVLSGLRYAAGELAVVWGLCALALLVLWSRRHGSRGQPGETGVAWMARPWILLLVVGLCLLPTSVLGRIKVASTSNALAFSGYFLLLAALLLLRDSMLEAPSGRTGQALRWAVVGTLLFELFAITWLQASSVERRAWRFDAASLPAEIAYRYALAHPGEVWFPRLGLSSYMAEGTIYHEGLALIDLQLAGRSIDEAYFRAGLPERLRAVAYFDNGYQTEIEQMPLPGWTRGESDPELPGFVIHRPPGQAR